ncbi:MAG: hypothetical protein NWF06_10670 [Candidatus Bathyarchaeota archaeon]|nr:hypothetical protein [Candidatus Bathyarchaeum sp.]
MFNSKKNPEPFTDFLYCLGSLERKNSQLFAELASKTVLSEVRGNLLKISEGNEMHAKVLIELSGRVEGPKPKTGECKRKLRPVCKLTESLLNQVHKKKTLSADELSSILLTLERSGGAMQYLQIQAETFLFMSKEISQLYGMNLEVFHDHIMEIAQQVEEHIELLEEVKTMIAQSTRKKDGMHHPVVKYQTPDAWFQPRTMGES